MGRSKFPGKPSKSINRKRISVLQLDEDASTTAATEPEDGVSSSATTCVGGDKRGGGGNCDDDEDGHNKKGGGPGSGIGGGGSSSQAGTSGSAGGSGGARNGRNVNGNSSAANNGSSNGAGGSSGASAADNVATHKQSTAAKNTAETAVKRAALNGVSGGKGKSRSSNRGKSKHKDTTDKKLATALDDNKQRDESVDKADDETRATRHTTATNDKVDADCKVTVAAHNAKKQQAAIMTMPTEDGDKMDAHTADMPEYAEMDEDDDDGCDVERVADDDIDEDEYEDDNASSTSRKSQQSGCSTASTTTSSATITTTINSSNTTTVALAFSRSKRDGKFKNLNLAKPEVMLPSSAKLRQLQKQNQLNCASPPPTANGSSSSSGGNNNATLTSCNNKSTTTTLPAATTPATSLFTRISNPFAVAGKLCATTNDTDDDEASCIMAVDAVINGAGVSTTTAQHGDSSVGGGGRGAAAAGAEDGCADNEGAAAVKPNTKTNEMPTTSCRNSQRPSDSTTTAAAAATVGNNSIGESATSTTTTSGKDSSKAAASTSSAAGTAADVSSACSTTATPSTVSSSSSSSSSCSSSSSSTASGSKQKKTVTFKNILETSDDKSAVKKFYNPDNRTPLISIMKKECMNRPLLYSRSSECIVRPSRLTEILKNNSNIDKLNSLKFRSSHTIGSGGVATATTTSMSSSSAVGGHAVGMASSTTAAMASVFGGTTLACAFGAPAAFADDRKYDTVGFRLSETSKQTANGYTNDINPKREHGAEGADSNGTHEFMAEELAGDFQRVDDDNENVKAAEEEDETAQEEDEEEEQQIVMDKHFVLPKRSTRSSRVIKPNKWLLEDGIICKKVSHAKTKQTHATTTATVVSTTTTSGSGVAAAKKEQQNYFGLGDYTETSKGAGDTLGIKSGKDNKSSGFGATTFGSNFSSLKANSFVLRQPRLQFDSLAERNATATMTKSLNNPATAPLSITVPKTQPAMLGLKASLSNSTAGATFGMSSVNNLGKSSPGSSSSLCSVCNTPVHCSNLQQPRKYGVPACIACRKFISKISKNSSNTSLKNSQLHCKGDGNCALQPHTKIHIKNFKKIYKERCTSCWLKKCLQTLQLSPGDKLSLSAALPHSLLKQVEAKRERDHEDDGEPAARKETDLADLSPTGGLFGTARFNWKSTLDATAEGLKLNLKSNPLAENNATFGSSAILRPPILEKPLFLKSPIEATPSLQQQQQQQQEKLEKTHSINSKNEGKAQEPAATENSTQRVGKNKRREKLEKEKDREKEKERVCKAPEREKERETSQQKSAANNKATVTETATHAIAVNTKSETNEIYTRSAKAASLSPTAIATTTTAAAETSSTALVASSTQALTATTTTGSTTTTATSELKRQRIDLKGPRVKHVCRSASIVLGQPLATFGEETEEDDEDRLTIAECELTAETQANLTSIPAKPDEIVIESSNEATTTTTTAETPPTQTKEPITTQSEEETLNKKAVAQQPEINTPSTQPQAKPSENGKTAAVSESSPPKAEPNAGQPVAKAPKISNNATAEKKEVNAVDETAGEATEKSLLPLQPSKAVTRNSNTSNINLQTQRNTATSSYATTFGKKPIRQISSDANIAYQQQQQQQLLRRKEPQRPKTLISIDFWENYDPAEVCQSGFGLIVTETVAQRALCFLCGSAGLEPLIFCACCCEPYHQYCVMDEYNLKHSSLDDTMLSFMDISTMGHSTAAPTPEQLNQITNRLNWLCPRCTVCYTCNMSSGSKVKCQKCQKNYHSTCLGTSKRLLGADRPLICVNCLKCKSCATTKVSKFVGNLPMCTPCFKLRKRGNYCPICQKCYDDNDFDLKMMECGNCNHWVHSKCEGLSDEQYNLLSTLPEAIEFICKKCARRNEDCKMKAAEWRMAVSEEFKSSLMSVLKLLSKSRQACTLLKLSPRKKMRCVCGNSTAQSSHRAQPKSLQFSNEAERLPHSLAGSDGDSQCSDVYEFKDKPSEGKLQDKCTCQLKTSSYSSVYGNNSAQINTLSLMDIKKKINNNDYVSLAEFNYDMINVIQSVNCDELVIAYNEILSEQFPWFQNETKACTDALEEDMYESCSYSLGNSMDAQDDFVEEAHNRSVIDLPEDIEEVLYSLKPRDDLRTCLFCRKSGEGLFNEESRLLYCGHDCWVHTNCAMWSAEVFEEIDGSLQNVHSAIARGRMIKCTVCGGRGATVGCNVKSCGEHYHYSCARNIACAFLTDKSVYCPEHARNALRSNSSLTIETNFEVARPVYVELDRKRKKLLEPSKVQFHIGSLEVKQLGSVFPRFSDTYEAIVPINFICSRLYWSFKEPWKVVEYTVRTVVQNNYSTLTALDAGRNFTVDHSNPNVSLVQLGLAQIACWHSSLARGELTDYDAVELRNSTLTKLLPEYLIQSQNSCPAPDENTEEEPQTNADLLPPEIKDAIFEDLPHDLLDGISMLDIFPKCMIYEEMCGTSEGRTAEMYLNEQSKDGAVNSTTVTAALSASSAAHSGNCSASSAQVSDEDTANSSLSKQLELSNSCSSTNTNIAIGHVEDALLSCTRATSTQLKRAMCASELQRSTAELRKKTFSKIESANTAAAAAAIKKRKLNKGLPELRLTESILQSLSQHRTKKDNAAITVSASRRQSVSSESECATTLRTKQFTWSAAKRYIEPHTADEKDDTKIKLMQVDGVDDSITEYRIITSDAQFTGTVKCERCQCTYRNYESFQRHFATCEPLSTSESESEATSRSPGSTVNGSPPLAGMDANIDLSKLGQAQRTATLTSSANSLPFLQAFSQAIPLGSIQANINGIPIANMSNGFQSVQGLQNIQTLQNIQGLQNMQLQSLQTPQPLGGGFFISPANPTTSSTDEVQLLNSLQGLTANLNGTYTLAPTAGFGTTTVQAAQQQPQLIAVSSSPDGTQQIIQLPSGVTTQSMTNQPLLQGLNAFQTLQTTNGDKKIVLPIASGKPLKTVATKSAQQAATAAKHKLKGNSNTVKPIQSKLNAATVTVSQPSIQTLPTATPITVLNTGNNATQLLNQNLLQQIQAAGLTATTTTAQQPQLLFQTGNGQQQPIVMQQLSAPNATVPQNIISFVTTDGTQTPQVQYMTIPTANDFKPQAQPTPFITATATPAPTNQFLQGAFLQTDASGNLMLTTTQTPTGLQMLSATPLNIATATPAPPQPQVIGTLINPQTLQLGGNVIATTADPQQQQQVIIGGGATGLEMIAASNAAAPQVILSTQPMYYGLETIVQNTVMSSQQFVSTAMPGVLSQNASFSATTTQVFQASKIEPIVDIPTGYVVLNNVDTTPTIVQQQPQTTTQQPNFLNATAVIQQQQQTTQNNDLQSNEQQQIFRLQTTENSVSATVTAATVTPTVTTSSFQFQPQLVEQQQHQPQQSNNNVHVVTAKVPPVAQVKRSNAVKATPMSTVTKVQPQQVVNKVLPTTVTQSTQQVSKLSNNNKAQQQQAYARNVAAANVAATAVAATAAAEAHITLTPATKAATSQQSNTVAYSKVSNHTDTAAVSIFVTSVTTTTTTSSINQATTVKALSSVPATVTTAAPRKTNLIRPITANKAEVKPKVLKTAANTVNKQQQQQQQQQSTQSQLLQQQQQQQQQLQQPQQQQQQQLQTTQAPAQQATKMAMLKPQPQTAQVCLPQPQQQQQQPLQQQQPQSQLQPPQFATEPSHNLTPATVPAPTMPMTHATANNNGNNTNKLLEYQQPAPPLQVQHFAEAPVVPQQSYNNAPTTMYSSGGVAPEEQHTPAPHLTNGNMTHSYDCSHQQQQPQLPHTQQIEFNSLSLEQVESFPPPTPQQQQPHEQENSILAAAHSNTNATLAGITNNNNNGNARCLQYTNSAFGNVNVPTNIVNPLQQTLQYNNNNNNNGSNSNATTTTMGSRPTNRVLPMQQRQEHIVATTPPLQVKPPTGVMPKMSVMNAVDAKCYDSRNAVNSAKIFYEAEVKKDEQMLHMLHSPQHHHQQQQQQQVMQMQLHEPHQETAIMMKSLSPEPHFADDSIKCDLDLIETETTLSTTCQQLQEMVHNNLPRYTGTCLVANEKPKELTPTPEETYALNGHVDALAGSDICEHDGDCMDDMDDDEDDDEEDEDEDDDGFSLKMPTEDDDHDMSDSDEPAVKEKISKILDNLTNEDCADSLATTTTAEATNIELNNVSYLSGMPGVSAKMAADTIKYQNGIPNNYNTSVNVDDNADVAAAATEYITQMAAKMSAHMPNGSLEVIGTNFDLPKLAPKVLPSMAITTTNGNLSTARQCDEVERAGALVARTQEPLLATRKPTPPPPPPQRDPKKISGPHLLYEIQSEDGFTYKSSSIADIWEKVFEAVQVARRAHGLSPLPEGPLADMAGVQMMGLKTNALKYLIEQLPGVERCTKYTPKYHKRATTNTHTGATNGGASAAAGNNAALLSATLAGSNIELNGSLDYASDPDELQENPYDSARCEPYATRSEYDMFSWLASRHRKQPIQVFVQPSDSELIPRRGTGSNLPMAMKYRTLKETYKDYVGVFRSHIHGRGLYCTKDIEAGEMVIEYAGELIRSTLTDKRERNYNSRGIGCYMFKIDDNLVVDATMRGNAARFINHSCEPNCYSKVVDILGHKHIIIFALRRIVQGEELTYDYKFPFEDEKIPCSCGSKRCRKYLN